MQVTTANIMIMNDMMILSLVVLFIAKNIKVDKSLFG